MDSIYVWGSNAEKEKDRLLKDLKLKWHRRKKQFFRERCDRRVLHKITSFCMKSKINYRTGDGQSYEVIPSEVIETSNRELRDWGPDISKEQALLEEIDYEQMWDEYKEEE